MGEEFCIYFNINQIFYSLWGFFLGECFTLKCLQKDILLVYQRQELVQEVILFLLLQNLQQQQQR